MDDASRRNVLSAPFALEVLLVLAQRGTTHGRLSELIGDDRYDRAKLMLEMLELAYGSDLMEFITEKGKEVVRELREKAGTKGSMDYMAEAESIRSAIQKR